MMESLGKYEGQKIKIVSTNGKIYFGKVQNFFPKDENEDGQECLLVELEPSKEWIGFPASHVKEISIIS